VWVWLDWMAGNDWHHTKRNVRLYDPSRIVEWLQSVCNVRTPHIFWFFEYQVMFSHQVLQEPMKEDTALKRCDFFIFAR
jgi:hypothetical protein